MRTKQKKQNKLTAITLLVFLFFLFSLSLQTEPLTGSLELALKITVPTSKHASLDPLLSVIPDPKRHKMAKKQSQGEEISPAQAVFLGALAPGVNGPTWTTLRLSFVMLGLCLAVMLGLAFSSSDSWLILHVAFLVLITMTLFLLLSWFLAQTGLVSVEHQIREMGLVPNDQEISKKAS